MIYELSLVTKADLAEQDLASLKEIVHETVKSYEGEILIDDDWGKLTLAQPTTKGVEAGHFLYFIYTANNQCNTELSRRFKINDHHLRHMMIALGLDEERETVVKAYKSPFSKKHRGSVTDESNEDSEGANPKKFARQKACYFKANQIKADWKDPETYRWIINEFGKISPARVTGVSRKHQRLATSAIKQARQVGIASYVSNRIAQSR